MAGNQVTLTIAGDARSLQQAAARASAATQEISDAVNSASREMTDAADAGDNFTTRMGHLGSAVDGATTAVDSIGGSLQALADIQQMAANRAARQARLLADVEQATIDLEYASRDLEDAILGVNQAFLDGQQAVVDEKRARNDAARATLDVAAATDELNKAVKEHGRGSQEAKAAQLDLVDAQLDLEEAGIAVGQAQQDANQAVADGKRYQQDATQAVRDGKDAQLDLNDAMREAHPPELQKWADNIQMVTPLITAAVGVLGLITAAQWLWNASLWASPVTWIVVAVIAVVAGIILLATHTKEIGQLWDATWSGIKSAAEAVGVWFRDVLWGTYIKGAWDGIVAATMWVKDSLVWQFNAWKGVAVASFNWFLGIPGQIRSAFAAVTGFLFAPFRAAFNMISSAWNGTVGRLSWTVPGWVPGVGGNSISAPKLPTFHSGGIVSGALGAETLAVLQAGERVTPAGGGGGPAELVIRSDGSAFANLVVDALRDAVSRRGGNVQRVIGVAGA